MDISSPTLPPIWAKIVEALENQLELIRKEESINLRLATRSLQAATNALRQAQESITNYVFNAGEEILFFKTVKPTFIGYVTFYSRLYKIESNCPPFDPAGIETYYTSELNKLATIYDEHRFIFRYLQNGSTFLDEKLFFRPSSDTIYSLDGLEPPADGPFNVCYDYAVGHLFAADLLRRHLLKTLDDLALPGHQAGNMPKLIFTAPKVHAIELGYALYASHVFNHGKAQLKDIMEVLEVMFHIKLGNYSRAFQEILYRHVGPTLFQDTMKKDYLQFIDGIEDKHIG